MKWILHLGSYFLLFSVGVFFSSHSYSKSKHPDLEFQTGFHARWEKIHDSLVKRTASKITPELDRWIESLRKLDQTSPYLPIKDKKNNFEGAIYILKGFAHAIAKENHKAINYYERGFEYLDHKGNWIRWTSPELLNGYAKSCENLKNPHPCSQRMQILLSAFPSTSLEYKALVSGNRYHQALSNQIAGERLSQTYKSPDLDWDAYDKIIKDIRENNQSGALSKIELFEKEYPRSGLNDRIILWKYILKNNKENTELLKKQILERPFTYFALHGTWILPQTESLDLFTSLSKTSISNIPSTGGSSGSYRSPILYETFFSPKESFLWNRALNHLNTKKPSIELAKIDLKNIKNVGRYPSHFLIELAQTQHKVKNHHEAFLAINEIFDRKDKSLNNRDGFNLIFPTTYWDQIQEHSKKIGVDPILVISLIKQESAFVEDAVSGSGAMGLMQLMPFTASETSPSTPLRLLSQLDHNLPIGITYLQKLLKQFNGRIAYALAAYNAGPNALNRWIKEYNPDQKIDFLTFVESIPYKETRNYVSAIARNYYWYHSLLNGAPPEKPVYEIFWQ